MPIQRTVGIRDLKSVPIQEHNLSAVFADGSHRHLCRTRQRSIVCPEGIKSLDERPRTDG